MYPKHLCWSEAWQIIIRHHAVYFPYSKLAEEFGCMNEL
jgi:hypothetical protein